MGWERALWPYLEGICRAFCVSPVGGLARCLSDGLSELRRTCLSTVRTPGKKLLLPAASSCWLSQPLTGGLARVLPDFY